MPSSSPTGPHVRRLVLIETASGVHRPGGPAGAVVGPDSWLRQGSGAPGLGRGHHGAAGAFIVLIVLSFTLVGNALDAGSFDPEALAGRAMTRQPTRRRPTIDPDDRRASRARARPGRARDRAAPQTTDGKLPRLSRPLGLPMLDVPGPGPSGSAGQEARSGRDGVSFRADEGRALGIAGGSGCRRRRRHCRWCACCPRRAHPLADGPVYGIDPAQRAERAWTAVWRESRSSSRAR